MNSEEVLHLRRFYAIMHPRGDYMDNMEYIKSLEERIEKPVIRVIKFETPKRTKLWLRSFFFYTFSTFIVFVLPETPFVIPPVITIWSPFSSENSFIAIFFAV